MSKAIISEIRYIEEPEHRVLNLRPDGVDCIPSLVRSKLTAIRQAPELHTHPNCVEFCLCLKGRLVFETPDGTHPLLPGQIFVSSPSQPHHLLSNPSGLALYSLLFKTPKPHQRILGLDERGSEWLARSLMHLPLRRFSATDAVKSAFERMFEIYDHVSRRSPSRRVMMRAASLNVLIELVRASREQPTATSGKIDEIARRIRKEPCKSYPAEELARECGVAVSTFANSFKRCMGLTLHAYLIDCRIEVAKDLLSHTDMTVTKISETLRFYSTQHFATTFRRIVGMNPKSYRANSLQATAVALMPQAPHQT